MKTSANMGKIDHLGRIVIPKKIRDMQGLEEGTLMELFIGDQGELVMKPYSCLPDAMISIIDSQDDLTKEKVIEIIKQAYGDHYENKRLY